MCDYCMLLQGVWHVSTMIMACQYKEFGTDRQCFGHVSHNDAYTLSLWVVYVTTMRLACVYNDCGMSRQ